MPTVVMGDQYIADLRIPTGRPAKVSGPIRSRLVNHRPEGYTSPEMPRRTRRKKPVHARVRKPMPRKPPKVEVPKTAYRRRAKHPGRTEEG